MESMHIKQGEQEPFYEFVQRDCTRRNADFSVAYDPNVRNLTHLLLAEMKAAREKLDQDVAGTAWHRIAKTNDFQEKKHYLSVLDNYPKGCCKFITDMINTRVMDPKNDSLLLKLSESGVLVKGIYGISDGKYFQNAFQVGDLYIDVSNDTVDPKKEQVVVMPLDEVQFENIDSYETYLDVIENYWGCTVFPNHLFPALSLVAPYLAITQWNGLCFLSDHRPTAVLPDMQDGFGGAKRVLFDSKYSERSLSTLQIEDITEKIDRVVVQVCKKHGEEYAEVLRDLSKPMRSIGGFKEAFENILKTREEGNKEESDHFSYKLVETLCDPLRPGRD